MKYGRKGAECHKNNTGIICIGPQNVITKVMAPLPHYCNHSLLHIVSTQDAKLKSSGERKDLKERLFYFYFVPDLGEIKKTGRSGKPPDCFSTHSLCIEHKGQGKARSGTFVWRKKSNNMAQSGKRGLCSIPNATLLI